MNYLLRSLAVCFCFMLLATPAYAAAGTRRFRAHAIGPTHIVVDANGIPVPLRLAGITLAPLEGTADHNKYMTETQDCLNEALMQVGGKVRVATSRGYKSSSGETPAVYAYVVIGGKEVLLNERPIAKGLAYYNDSDTQRDSKQKSILESAQAEAKRQTLGIWSLGKPKPKPKAAPAPAAAPSAPAPKLKQVGICPEYFYAEEGSRTYYPGSNAWVKKIDPKKLREFKTEAKALATGLRPFLSAAKSKPAVRKTSSSGKGKLVGLKRDKCFHGPLCPLVKDKSASSKVFFDTLDATKAAGRTGCRSCIRLGDPNCPQPAEGECIGRMPFYFRPCHQKGEPGTRLCKICSGLVK